MQRLLTTTALVLVLSAVAHAQKRPDDLNTLREEVNRVSGEMLVRDSLACHLKVISWVQVDFEGKLLSDENYKAYFERLVRLRLRNDLSMIGHEVLPFGSALRQVLQGVERWPKGSGPLMTPDMKQRGQVYCRVWTYGEAYPVALHLICRLSGYGEYENLFTEFTAENLGIVSPETVVGEVDNVLRMLITDIAAALLEVRDRCPKK